MTLPAKQTASGDIMEAVIAKGDLGKLTPDERLRYYSEVCRSLGLNALTQPFSYIMLNGKLTLYATRACADQLRKINGVSLEIVSRDVSDDILTVHVRAKLPDGRTDEDLGSVAFPSTLKGENRANAELKAVTKAKRRATLSVCGLGWLDETEIADIPASAKRPAPAAANVMLPAHDETTGEVVEDEPGSQEKPEAPTAEEYVARWSVILDAATDAKQLTKAWNDQKGERGNIEWPDDDTFEDLKNRVTKAIKFLKAPA